MLVFQSRTRYTGKPTYPVDAGFKFWGCESDAELHMRSSDIVLLTLGKTGHR
jgi:hypothetical protein